MTVCVPSVDMTSMVHETILSKYRTAMLGNNNKSM